MNRYSDYTIGNHHRTSPGVTKVINKHRPQVCHSYGNRNEKTSLSWFTKVAFLLRSVAVHKFSFNGSYNISKDNTLGSAVQVVRCGHSLKRQVRSRILAVSVFYSLHQGVTFSKGSEKLWHVNIPSGS